jgi:hypothetical protein
MDLSVGYIAIICIAAGLSLFVQGTPARFRLFMLACAGFEMLNVLKIASGSFNSFPVMNIYVIVQVSYFLYEYMHYRFSIKVIRVVILSYCAICLLNYFFYQGQNSINSITYNLGMFGVVFFIIQYFRGLLMDPNEVYLFNKPKFWLGTGIVLFYAPLLPILLFSDKIILLYKEGLHIVWDMVVVGNYFLSLGYIMYILAPWMKKT